MKTYITTSEHFELTTNKSVNTLNNTLGRDFTFEQCDLTVTNQAPQTNLLAKSIESFYIKKSYENNRYSINTITTQQEQPCRNKLIADLQNVEGFSLNSSINLHQQENLNIHHDYKSLHDELVENFSINKKNGARTYVADESENKSEVFSSISCKKKKVITVMKRIIKNIPAKSQERINLQVQRCFKLYSLVKEKTRKKSHIKLRNYFKIWLQHSNVKFNQKKKKVKDYFFRIKKIFENKTLYFALSRLRKISDRKEFENILRCKILKNLLIHLGRINLAYSFNKFSRNSLKSQKKIKVTTATMYQFHKIIIGFLFKRRLFLLAKIFSRWKMENFVIKNQKYLRLAYSQVMDK